MTVGRLLTAPFRLIPWYVWLALIAAAAWFGRNILLIIATIIAFHPVPVPPLFMGEPETLAEAQLQDLQHFEHVRRNERSFTEASRARFDAQIDYLTENAGALSEAEFLLGLARAQAAIDNGHSNASVTRMVEGFPRLPVRLAVMDGELVVLRALEGYEDLLGARLLAIGDTPAMDVLYRFRDTLGGNEAFFEDVAPLFLTTPAFMSAVGFEDDAAYRMETRAGEIVETGLPVIAPDPEDGRVYAGEMALPWRVESEAWRSFEPQGAPLYLARPERDYWLTALDQPGLAYLNLRSNLDDGEESIRAFSARALEELRAMAPAAIIVDQRFNGGGDLTQTHDLFEGLADIVGADGRVYLISSGATFSAAIVNIAVAKEAAGDRAVQVGEPVGDRMQFWAEGFWYSLPNSNFRARYSTGFYDFENGCSGIFRCHWGSLHLFPVIIDDLDIDLPAPLDIEAYAAGRDPAMEATLAAEAARR